MIWAINIGRIVVNKQKKNPPNTATANQKLADTNFSLHVDPTMPFPLLVEGVNVPLFDSQYIDCSLTS